MRRLLMDCALASPALGKKFDICGLDPTEARERFDRDTNEAVEATKLYSRLPIPPGLVSADGCIGVLRAMSRPPVKLIHSAGPPTVLTTSRQAIRLCVDEFPAVVEPGSVARFVALMRLILLSGSKPFA
jgi:hypothetical protein